MSNKQYQGIYERYCNGYGFGSGASESSRYVACPSISYGIVDKDFSPKGLVSANKLNGIVAFDKAEISGPMLGQTNMITVSSFCGIYGKLWGYELVSVGKLDKLNVDVGVPVFNADPLIDATRSLFGTVSHPNFQIVPGGHIPAATKDIVCEGGTMYGALAMTIPEDRSKDAILFMEDLGLLQEGAGIQSVYEQMARASLKVCEQQQIKPREILIALKSVFVPQGKVGCMLLAVPYVQLPKRAIPRKSLELLTLDEWVRATKYAL